MEYGKMEESKNGNTKSSLPRPRQKNEKAEEGGKNPQNPTSEAILKKKKIPKTELHGKSLNLSIR